MTTIADTGSGGGENAGAAAERGAEGARDAKASADGVKSEQNERAAPPQHRSRERNGPRRLDDGAVREASRSAFHDRDAHATRLVDEVPGDAIALERYQALRHQVQQLVVAAERGGAAVLLPVRLADDLSDVGLTLG